MTVISLVLARADNGVIGNAGGLPWRLPDDMRRFKALTMGKPVIMGRKTWESLPRKPLSGRTNIVVTRDANFRADGAAAVQTLDAAIVRAQAETPEEIAIIGGAEIYQAAVPLASRIHLTEVHMNAEGDTHMPAFDKRIWRETAREDHPPSTEGGIAFSYVTLERNK